MLENQRCRATLKPPAPEATRSPKYLLQGLYRRADRPRPIGLQVPTPQPPVLAFTFNRDGFYLDWQGDSTYLVHPRPHQWLRVARVSEVLPPPFGAMALDAIRRCFDYGHQVLNLYVNGHDLHAVIFALDEHQACSYVYLAPDHHAEEHARHLP